MNPCREEFLSYRDTDIENRFVDTMREGEGGMNLNVYISIYKIR